MTKYLIGPSGNPRQAVWLDDKDPTWAYLRRSGFDKIYDVEVVPEAAPELPVELLDALVEERKADETSVASENAGDEQPPEASAAGENAGDEQPPAIG